MLCLVTVIPVAATVGRYGLSSGKTVISSRCVPRTIANVFGEYSSMRLCVLRRRRGYGTTFPAGFDYIDSSSVCLTSPALRMIATKTNRDVRIDLVVGDQLHRNQLRTLSLLKHCKSNGTTSYGHGSRDSQISRTWRRYAMTQQWRRRQNYSVRSTAQDEERARLTFATKP